jgi:RNA polymerase sigma factor (sigma-70 family)
VLHYLMDLPVAEVATELGISPGTVKATLHHARANLRKQLEVIGDV